MSTYSTRRKPPKTSWYTMRRAKGSNTYDVFKFNELREHQETYTLVVDEVRNSYICNCFAGMKWCRHKKMFGKFKANKAIDSGAQYNYDKDIWKEPETPEEL